MGFWATFFRSARLRCPRCGRGRLFRGWFRMHPRCEACGLVYDRGPGYFLGSIYFNYGLTAILVTVLYFAAYFSELASPRMLLWGLAGFSVAFPLWFFRYARSLWVGFDQYYDPEPDEKSP